MVASIGMIAWPSQGVSYDAKDDPAHKEGGTWRPKGTEALGR